MFIVGCDIHPSWQQIAVFDNESGEVNEYKLSSGDGAAEQFYRKLPAPARIGLEACGNSQWFVQLLQELGHEVWIGDAAQIRASYIRKQKTDKRDALHILKLLLEDGFPRLWTPTAEIGNQRQLLVHRHKLVRLRAQVKNELQHLALNQGVQKKARRWSQAGQKLLRELPLAGWAASRRANLLELMKLMDRQIAELDRALEQAAEENPQARLLRTQPGVGPVTALAFVLTLGDVSRFPRGKQVSSYLGLIPREHSSGGRQRLGAISKQGNRFLRQTLVEAAHSVVRLDEGFRKQYQRRCHRKPKGVAKVAAARKLAVRLYGMLRTNIGYPEIVHIESRPLVPLVDHGQTETLNGRSRIQQTGAKDGPAGLGKR